MKQECKCAIMIKKSRDLMQYFWNLIRGYLPSFIPFLAPLIFWFFAGNIIFFSKVVNFDKFFYALFGGALVAFFSVFTQIYKERKENLSHLVSALAAFRSIEKDLEENKNKIIDEYTSAIMRIVDFNSLMGEPILFAPFFETIYDPINCSETLSFMSIHNFDAIMDFKKADRCLFVVREIIEKRNIQVQKQCRSPLIDKVEEVRKMHDNYRSSLIIGINEVLSSHQICFDNIEGYIKKYHYFFNYGILKVINLNRFYSLK